MQNPLGTRRSAMKATDARSPVAAMVAAVVVVAVADQSLFEFESESELP